VYAGGATTSAGTITPAVVAAATDEVAAAVAAMAARVFLFRLPGGRPRHWGTGGVASTSIRAFLRLPNSGPACITPGRRLLQWRAWLTWALGERKKWIWWSELSPSSSPSI
jgi:hypothetical protein